MLSCEQIGLLCLNVSLPWMITFVFLRRVNRLKPMGSVVQWLFVAVRQCVAIPEPPLHFQAPTLAFIVLLLVKLLDGFGKVRGSLCRFHTCSFQVPGRCRPGFPSSRFWRSKV